MSKEKALGAQEKYKLLKKKLRWLDKNPRAACFYFFYIARFLSEWRSAVVRQDHIDEPSQISARALGTESIELSIEKNKAATLPGMMPEFNFNQTNEGKGYEGDELLENILNTNLESASEKSTLGKMSTPKKMMPPDFYYANGIYSPFMREMATGVDDVFECVLRELCDAETESRRKLIKAINTAWGQACGDFPEAFSWLDINDEKQCLWVWNLMKKKAVCPPINPLNNYQRWLFICATFDQWEGWTHEQLSYLKGNRKKMSQNFADLLTLPRSPLRHKAVLMGELQKAWDQKLFRRQSKENDMTIKISARTKKKLARLSEIYGESESDLMSSLIEREYAGLMVKTEKVRAHS